MFSRGCLNGAALDEWELDGGNFVEEAAATADIVIAGSAFAHRRANARAMSSFSIDGLARISLKLSTGGAIAVAIGHTAKVTRRAVASGMADMGVSAVVTANRRASMQASVVIRLDGVLLLSHLFLREAGGRRMMEMPAEARLAMMIQEARGFVVEPIHLPLPVNDQERSARLQAHLREFYVGADREVLDLHGDHRQGSVPRRAGAFAAIASRQLALPSELRAFYVSPDRNAASLSQDQRERSIERDNAGLYVRPQRRTA